jgi:hypothetical protein
LAAGRIIVPVLAALILLVLPSRSAAQGASEPAPAATGRESTPRFASPFLPPDHWVHGAARRLEAAGLAPEGFGAGAQSRTQREIAALFEQAEVRAVIQAPELAPLARAYRARFAEEFSWTAGALFRGVESGKLQGLGARIRVGYDARAGEALAGVGYNPKKDWTGAVTLPGRKGSASAVSASLALPPYVAFSISPVHRTDIWELDEAHLSAGFGVLGLWAGRRALGSHPGAGGGVVLSEGGVFDGAGLFLTEPLRLPGWLGLLGPMRFEVFGSRVENNDRVQRPLFAGMRGSVQPHPRLGVGASRAVMFGGEGNTGVRARDLVYMLIGKHAGAGSELDNQVVAIDIHYRPPLGALPLAVYLEWGMEDSAGAWRDEPGRVLGVEIPALPGVPELGVGLERTTFAGSRNGKRFWYRHWSFRQGWTDDGRVLGHPLGGHGTEWLTYARADLFEARGHLDLHLFARERGEENLLAPERAGHSRGVRLGLEGRLASGLGVFFQGVLEDGGAGWRESALRAGAQWVF